MADPTTRPHQLFGFSSNPSRIKFGPANRIATRRVSVDPPPPPPISVVRPPTPGVANAVAFDQIRSSSVLPASWKLPRSELRTLVPAPDATHV